MKSQNFNDRLLGYREIKDRGVPYTKYHLGRLEKLGQFPRRIFLSVNRICWRESEINEWIQVQISRRDAATSGGGK